MKKLKLMILVMVLMVCSVTPSFCATEFHDVEATYWFYNDLQYILNDSRKIIAGYPDGSFRPLEELTVEQFIKMVVLALGHNPTAKSNQRWSEPYIQKAIELGVIGSNDFSNYQAKINRGEMARIIVKVVPLITGEYKYRNPDEFIRRIRDYEEIPNEFKDCIIKVYDMGIIGGYPDGTFKAGNGLSRQEAVAVMRRIIDKDARLYIDLDNGFRDGVYKINPNIPSELYDFDWRKQKWDGKYYTNNWMIEKYGLDKVTEFMNIGKGYVETYYNVDYKTINQSTFKSKIQWYFMPQTNWIADDGILRPIEEHFFYWSDNVIEKQIQMEMKFITDPSLVYSDGSTIIRGMAEYTVKSCNDMAWLANYTEFCKGIQIGKTYQMVVEIKIVNKQQYEGWEHAEKVVNQEFYVTDPREVTK